MSFTVGLSHGAICPADGCPCKNMRLKESIWYAASTNDVAMIRQRLRERPTLANLPDSYGYTAVHFASQRNHVQALQCLLAHGAHPDGPSEGAGVAGSGVADGGPRVCKATPLHRAAFAGAAEACELLVEAGAALNARDLSFRDNRTPLMKAASQGHTAIVALLLRAGADPTLLDAAGLTHQDIALHAPLQDEQETGETYPVLLCGVIGLSGAPLSPPPSSSSSSSSSPAVSRRCLPHESAGDHAGASVSCTPPGNEQHSPLTATMHSMDASSGGVSSGAAQSGGVAGGLRCCKCGVTALGMSKVAGKLSCIPCRWYGYSPGCSSPSLNNTWLLKETRWSLLPQEGSNDADLDQFSC